MPHTVTVDDPYRPLARMLPVAERIQDVINGSMRRAVVQILTRRDLVNVLDVGCGTGALCRCLAKAGLSPVGIDPSPTMLRRAQIRSGRGAPFILGDGAQLPFGAVFDAAVSSLALHEMDPDKRASVYAEMHRVVRPGGLVVLADFTEPERPTTLARIARAFIQSDERGFARIHPPHYVNYVEFMDRGGLTAWVRSREGVVREERRLLCGNVGVLAIQR